MYIYIILSYSYSIEEVFVHSSTVSHITAYMNTIASSTTLFSTATTHFTTDFTTITPSTTMTSHTAPLTEAVLLTASPINYTAYSEPSPVVESTSSQSKSPIIVSYVAISGCYRRICRRARAKMKAASKPHINIC